MCVSESVVVEMCVCKWMSAELCTFETWAVGEFYIRAIEKSFQKLASVKVLKKISA